MSELSQNKRPSLVFAALAVLLLASCATGRGYNGWTPSVHERPAQQPPSRLISSPAGVAGNPVDHSGRNPDGLNQEQTAAPSQNSPHTYTYANTANTNDSYRVPPERWQHYDERHDRRQQDAARAAEPAKVAILLPLSGDRKDIGQSMLNSAQMALFDSGTAGFELLPKDTKGTPAGARLAADEAAREGAALLLGPLFASSVKAVNPVARRYGLNMLAFSTDWTLADRDTFITGFLPFAQVRRISEYAARKGIRRIGILAPNDQYGNVVTRTFQEYAVQNGLEIVDVVKYNPLQKDLSPAIRTFTDYDRRVGLLEQNKEAIKARLESNPGDREAELQLAVLEQMTSYGELPFDAVLMPMGGDQARTLANLLSYYDLGPDKVKRLGTGLWDDPSLAREPHLNGAAFAAPSPAVHSGFSSRYYKLYGEHPPRLASLAYDATALAAVLARNSAGKSRHEVFSRPELINPNGFTGIDGIFRFRPDGLIERGLSVLEYRNGTITEAERAPDTFQTPL